MRAATLPPLPTAPSCSLLWRLPLALAAAAAAATSAAVGRGGPSPASLSSVERKLSSLSVRRLAVGGGGGGGCGLGGAGPAGCLSSSLLSSSEESSSSSSSLAVACVQQSKRVRNSQQIESTRFHPFIKSKRTAGGFGGCAGCADRAGLLLLLVLLVWLLAALLLAVGLLLLAVGLAVGSAACTTNFLNENGLSSSSGLAVFALAVGADVVDADADLAGFFDSALTGFCCHKGREVIKKSARRPRSVHRLLSFVPQPWVCLPRHLWPGTF